MFANIFVATTNLFNSFKQTSIEGVIGKFVSFKVLLQIQDYYMRQRSNFRIKKAVQSDPLTVNPDKRKIFPTEPAESAAAEKKRIGMISRNKLKCLYFIYKITRFFYSTLYYYFFPMSVMALPFLKLMRQIWIYE